MRLLRALMPVGGSIAHDRDLARPDFSALVLAPHRA